MKWKEHRKGVKALSEQPEPERALSVCLGCHSMHNHTGWVRGKVGEQLFLYNLEVIRRLKKQKQKQLQLILWECEALQGALPRKLCLTRSLAPRLTLPLLLSASISHYLSRASSSFLGLSGDLATFHLMNQNQKLYDFRSLYLDSVVTNSWKLQQKRTRAHCSLVKRSSSWGLWIKVCCWLKS